MNPLLKAAILAFVLLVPGCASSPRVPEGQLSEKQQAGIDAIGQKAITESGIVGLSIGVALEGKIVYAQGFGHADTERTIPAHADTIYDIASVGKHYTAAAILRLAEEGKLSLDQRVREIVPELPANFPNATIEQLLRHTSGFVGGELDEQNPPADYNTKRYALELLTDLELRSGKALFKPDETWVYCNPGYLILGIIVDVVSGQRYADFIRNELLIPVGLDEVSVCERAVAPRMSQSIRRTEAGIAEVAPIDMTAYSGQGAICSSVVDLLRWSHALNTGQIVSSESLAQMRSPSVVRGNQNHAVIPYGFAQRLGEVGPFHRVGHTGTFDGGSASIVTFPEANLEIAVLSNTRGSGTPHARSIELEIAKLLLGVKVPDAQSLRQALGPEDKRRIMGFYTNGNRFQATFEGDELVVLRDAKPIERLIHIGGLRFRSLDAPDVTQWFVLDGDRAGWWIYSTSGTFLEVLRRE